MSRLFERVSTRPRPRSYRWGGHASYLARAAFFGIYALRLLSPLQWIKHVYRERGRARSTTNSRPDFPAALSEIYFLAVLGLAGGAALLQHLSVTSPGWLRSVLVVLGAVLLLESVVWIVYYLLLRSLVEGSYTIYHPAEYLLTFPVLIATQTFLVSAISGVGVTTVLAALTGNPESARPLLVALSALGLVYLTAALSVLLTSHPGIEPRRPQMVTIIGAGDVTVERILPALDFLKFSRKDVLVASLGGAGALSPGRRAAIEQWATLACEDSEEALLARVQAEGAPAIIASPTSAHFRQILELERAGEPFAVEKPIVASAAEREVLRLNPRLMERGFALSYYVLEKALPLTYFAEPLPAYRRYLVSDPPSLLDGHTFQNIRDALGSIVSVELTLLEGPERSPSGRTRHWTEEPASLRPFVETCIHPLAILRTLFPRHVPEWKRVVTGVYAPRRDDVGEIAPTFVRAEAGIGTADATVLVGKHIEAPPTRGMVVEHRGGRLVCDFDERRLGIAVEGSLEGTIAVSDRWAQKYAVQMDLVRSFMLEGHGSVRYDRLAGQLDALDWWDSLCDWVEHHEVVPFEYRDDVDPVALSGSGRARA